MTVLILLLFVNKDKIKMTDFKKKRNKGQAEILKKFENFVLFNIVTRLFVLDTCYCQVRN